MKNLINFVKANKKDIIIVTIFIVAMYFGINYMMENTPAHVWSK